MAVVFAEVGQDLHIQGSFEDAVNEGVRQGYTEGLLRCSVVADPIRRGIPTITRRLYCIPGWFPGTSFA